MWQSLQGELRPSARDTWWVPEERHQSTCSRSRKLFLCFMSDITRGCSVAESQAETGRKQKCPVHVDSVPRRTAGMACPPGPHADSVSAGFPSSLESTIVFFVVACLLAPIMGPWPPRGGEPHRLQSPRYIKEPSLLLVCVQAASLGPESRILDLGPCRDHTRESVGGTCFALSPAHTPNCSPLPCLFP